MMGKLLLSVGLLAWILTAAALSAAQPACEVPPIAQASRAANIFSDQQEQYLGEAWAEHLESTFSVVKDESLNEYLGQIGERLLRNLPPTKMHYQFRLIDTPSVNAFSAPGGRIYLSRKLIAAARTEDEVAGVMAHELGHSFTHQQAIELTRLFHAILGVNTVGDRADIFEKYNRFIENAGRKRQATMNNERQEDRGQQAADEVAIYALAKAGYRTQAFSEFWDRFTENQGKTGSALSDFFGTTKPESRRLRFILKIGSALPPHCFGAPPMKEGKFPPWQAAVIAYSAGQFAATADAGLPPGKLLSPPLRNGIEYLRFSPDGNFIVAQDDATIFVLSRSPLAVLFSVDAPDAYPAQFSADSKRLIFYDPSLRVEEWDRESKARVASHEIALRTPCLQSALSPDGKTMACLEQRTGGDFGLSTALVLIDVSTGKTLYTRDDFPHLRIGLEAFLVYMAFQHQPGAPLFNMSFTPDSRYFVMGHGEESAGYGLQSGSVLAIPPALREYLAGSFSFLSPDRMVAISATHAGRAGIVAFPSGHLLSPATLAGSVTAVSHGDYAIVRPIKDYAAGIFDLTRKRINIAADTKAVDVYDQMAVSESRAGQVVFTADTTKPGSPFEALGLPTGNLGSIRTVAVSSDWKWIAISGKSRSGIWNAETGKLLALMRDFRGGFFATDGSFYADVPKYKTNAHAIARVTLETQPRVSVRKQFSNDHEDAQMGELLLTTKYQGSMDKILKNELPDLDMSAEKNVVIDTESGNRLRELLLSGRSHDTELEVRDVTSDKLLWSRIFNGDDPDRHFDTAADAIVLVWRANQLSAKAEIRKRPDLQKQLAALGDKSSIYLLQAVKGRTGKEIASMLVDSGKGSFSIRQVAVTAKHLVINDSENRILIYSLETQRQTGRIFGHYMGIAPQAELMAVANRPGEISVYDVVTAQPLHHYSLPKPARIAEFSADGRQMLLVTADQTLRKVDLAKGSSGH